MPPPRLDRALLRDALGIGLASGAYGISFGALARADGASTAQAAVLSLLLFSGGSQFALIGVLGGGGTAVGALGATLLLGVRNGLYGLRVATLFPLRPLLRPVAAQLVIDETTAMAITHEPDGRAQQAFWVTGVTLYALWNAGTLLGAFGATFLGDPKKLGLDAAVPAAFLGLLAPQLRRGADRRPLAVAAAAALVTVAVVPVVPVGVPVLLAALVAVPAGLRR